MAQKFEQIEQQASYGIGRQMGEQLLASAFAGLDVKLVCEGLSSAFTGQESELSPDVINAAFNTLRTRVQEQQAEQHKMTKAAGEEFLRENAKRADVQVTASGLQYEIIAEGQGAAPVATSHVRTHYHGTLLDGTVFDSSYQRGEPAEFPVNGVIAGWTEALQKMQVGAKWRLYLPYQLAYGERGAGGKIGPYATLIFEVELLAVLD